MKFRWDKKYLNWGITLFGSITASICFYYLLFHGVSLKTGLDKVVNISMPVINGLAFAYLLTPIVNFIESRIIEPILTKYKINIKKKRKGKIRFVSVILTVFVFMIFVYGFFAMVIPQLIKSIQSIVLQFPIYITNLEHWVMNLLSDNPNIESVATELFNQYSPELEKWINQGLLPQINQLVRTLSTSLIGFFKALWNLILGFIISIYLLSSKELFKAQSKKVIYAILEPKAANSFLNSLRFTHKTFSGFLGGKILDSIIIGILCFICTSFIGTPYPVLISVIIGITNIIPFFGPYLGAIPSSILILMVDPIQCLYFIIFILFLQQFDGNVLGPKILGDSTGLSGFWVIFSITIFGGLFGIFGMFIGVPTFAVILAAFKSICNRLLHKKGLSTETGRYLNLSVVENNEFIDIPIKATSKEGTSIGSKLNKMKNRKPGNQEDSDRK